jgi:hypothetical protein
MGDACQRDTPPKTDGPGPYADEHTRQGGGASAGPGLFHKFATRAHVQPAKVGVDTGSKEVGIAARQSGGDRQGRALGRLVLAGWPGHGRSRQV